MVSVCSIVKGAYDDGNKSKMFDLIWPEKNDSTIHSSSQSSLQG